MLGRMRDPEELPTERMKAAINAAPYVHPKLQNIAHTGDKDDPVAIAVDQSNMTDIARRIAFVLSRGAAKAE
jgi:hypothetical protein